MLDGLIVVVQNARDRTDCRAQVGRLRVECWRSFILRFFCDFLATIRRIFRHKLHINIARALDFLIFY